MSNIKKFLVEHVPTFGEIVVEIDFDFVAEIKNNTGTEKYPVQNAIEDMVKFWTGSELRVAENEGNYTHTFLKQLCSHVIGIIANRNLSEYGVIEEMKEEEGWCPLDGSFGIKLIRTERPVLDSQDDFTITEA